MNKLTWFKRITFRNVCCIESYSIFSFLIKAWSIKKLMFYALDTSILKVDVYPFLKFIILKKIILPLFCNLVYNMRIIQF